MMRLDKLSQWIGNLHDNWSFVVRDVDVEKTFGMVLKENDLLCIKVLIVADKI